ncbi:MAG: tRNA (N6-threonylcarbamoyladenosine(37)-N6)-methyltransferase TrmO [Prolixibacteraceae bacterium]|nr:tRNA (N6-threonylcarbamoyladenosine(37)-N6)-methyltransferase TrmO [Prolixibacteraceae bacterium]
MKTKNSITYHPIGIFHSNYHPKTGAPRQGILYPENRGIIELFEPYTQALETLDMFERIIVLFHFDRVQGWDANVNPPESSHNHHFGLFSTRSPRRPNPIGMTNVKLEKIEGGKLFVSGIDAFDGTPILDIKPYLPSVDCVSSQQNEDAEAYLGHHNEDYIDDPAFFY